jgi:hypothetical protein
MSMAAPSPPQRRYVDRSIARVIAYKRLFTGTLGVVGGVVMIVAGVVHGGSPPPLLVLASVMFFGVGGWALRDGIRLHRALRR